MANRDLTVAELKAMLENLADKVTEEGADLYQDIAAKVDMMATASSAKAAEMAAELGPKLERLKAGVLEEGKEMIDLIEMKADAASAEIQGEIAEFREVGLVAWIKSNPMTALGLGAVIVALVALAVMLFTGGPTPTP